MSNSDFDAAVFKELLLQSMQMSPEVAINMIEADIQKINKFNIFKNRYIEGGNSPESVSLDNVAIWIFLKTKQYGVEKVIEDLNNFFSLTGEIPGFEILILAGVVFFDQPIEFNNGIKLVPTRLLPSIGINSINIASFDSSAITQTLKDELSNLAKLSPDYKYRFSSIVDSGRYDHITAALICPTSSKMLNPDHDSGKHYKTKEEVFLQICHCLTLLNRDPNIKPMIAAVPIVRLWEPEEWVPTAGGFPCTSIVIRCCYDRFMPSFQLLEKEKIPIIRDIVNCFLSHTNKDKFTIPLERLTNAVVQKDFRSKVIEFGITMESLFLGQSNNNTELKYRLSQRAAWFLNNDNSIEERQKICELFKKLYNYRCGVVHSGKLKSNDAQQRKELIEGIELISKVIYEMIKTDIPTENDWDQITLGKNITAK
jgi:hypothetical protein